MWVRLKSLNGVLNTSVIAVLICCFHLQAIGQTRLTGKDLENPDLAVQKVKEHVSKRDQILAEDYYQDALKRMKQNYWDAAAKNFGESALLYPTAKAFIGMAEAEARIARRHNRATKLLFLEGISKYLTSAAAVDAFQKQLMPMAAEQLKQDIDCINKFLATHIEATSCRLVNIAFEPRK